VHDGEGGVDDAEIEVDQGATVRLDDGFYKVKVRELVFDFGGTFGFHYEVDLLADSGMGVSLHISDLIHVFKAHVPAQSPGLTDMLTTAVEGREINESSIILRRLT
jgi:hypothetical protein